MEVDVNIKWFDLINMNLLLLPRLKQNYIWFCVMLIAAGAGAFDAIANNGLHIWILMALSISVVMFSIIFLIGNLICVIFATSEKGFIGLTSYKLSDDFFEETTKGTLTKTSWSSIVGYYLLKNYIFVRINGYRVHIVPKREFSCESEFKEFCNYVVDKVKNS